MNALAHCVEALYPGELEVARRGAAGIDAWLPRVLEDGHDLEARTRLLAGGERRRPGARGARPVPRPRDGPGGRRALRPPARRDERALPAAGDALQRAGRCPDAMTAVPVERVEELARLAGFERLRDFGRSEDELDELGAAAAERPGAKANPRPASAAEVAELYRSVW